MSITLTALMKQRYDTAANWTAQNPTLLAGEIGIESDTKKWKVGTGATAWTSLVYAIGGTYPIVNADIAAGAAIAYSKLATLISGNIVLGSAANVATSTAVTGDVTISNTGVTAIAAGVIVNADINASAGIVDTKLATIATPGKVSNSATTAVSANTASAIVARDASGNFTAGTITAALTGAASSNVLKAGDTMTGPLVTPAGTVTANGIQVGTGTTYNPGIYSPGADQLAISTGGTERLRIDSSGRAGIGTSVPAQTLHVNGSGTQYFQVSSTSNDATTLLGATSAGSFLLNQSTTLPTQIWTNGNPRIHISSAGNVGIGTPSPQAALHVTGSSANAFPQAGGALWLSDTNAGTNVKNWSIVSTSGDYLLLTGSDTYSGGELAYKVTRTAGAGGKDISEHIWYRGASTESARIDSSGRLGLGVSSPTSLVHLADAGNITVGTTTGTKIGTATTQKLGFYNATPVVQPAAVADATIAIGDVITQLNDLLAKLRTLGIIAT